MKNKVHPILIMIRSVHTLIWALLSGVVLFVLWSGMSGELTRASWYAVAVILAEGLVLVFFKGKCPLTVMAERYTASRLPNFDIYLPVFFARYNKLICGGLYATGLILMIVRFLS